MCTTGIWGWVLINTLDWPLINMIDNRLILSWHSIDTLVDTPLTPWLTLHRHLGWQSANFHSMHMSRSTLSRLLISCWSGVNWVSTDYQSGCWSSTDRDVDREYRSTLDWGSLQCTWSDFNFISPCFLLVLDLIEKIYLTLETVFDHISKHLEACQSYSSSHFQLSSRCLECGQTWSFMSDV